MKIFFLRDDSLYKIFKTIEKLPSNKPIDIHIAQGNPFFDHPWRGQQIAQLVTEKKITATFIAKNTPQKLYYRTHGLLRKEMNEPKINQIFHVFYLFFFNIKKFHLLMLTKKSRGSMMIIALELFFLGVVGWIFYSFVVPSTTITLYQAYQTEKFVYNIRYYPNTDPLFVQYTSQLAAPYYTGSLLLNATTQFSLDDILYKQKPAQGSVRLFNTTNVAIPLVKNTQLVTDDGLLYNTTAFVSIPPAQGTNAGSAIVSILAQSTDTSNQLMGKRGNITQLTKLFIRKLKQSYYTKEIYALPLDDFTNGETIQYNEITQKDLDLLQKTLAETIEKNTDSSIKSRTPSSILLLPTTEKYLSGSDKFIYEIIDDSIISGTLLRTVPYTYVRKKDVMAVFDGYLQERRSQLDTIVSLIDESLLLLDIREKTQGVFVVSTQVSLIKGYNFDTDTNLIKSDILQKIQGEDKKTAKEVIEQYPEIARADIAISPFWYNTISKIQSRIRFIITQ